MHCCIKGFKMDRISSINFSPFDIKCNRMYMCGERKYVIVHQNGFDV